jgi:hypothetical protein
MSFKLTTNFQTALDNYRKSPSEESAQQLLQQISNNVEAQIALKVAQEHISKDDIFTRMLELTETPEKTYELWLSCYIHEGDSLSARKAMRKTLSFYTDKGDLFAVAVNMGTDCALHNASLTGLETFFLMITQRARELGIN